MTQHAWNRQMALMAWLDGGVPGHRAKRYGAAVLATGSALAAAAALSEVASYAPLLLFAAAVAIAARYGGRGPALIASVLSVIAIDLVFLQPTSGAELAHPHPLLRLGIFLIVALAISSMSQALHKARRTAERHAAQLERVNVELEQQMEEVKTLSEHLQETNESLVIARDDERLVRFLEMLRQRLHFFHLLLELHVHPLELRGVTLGRSPCLVQRLAH